MSTGNNQKKGKDNPCFINRIGEKHISNQGYEVEIIEYFNTRNCTIKFNDERETILSSIQYVHIKNKNIRNPYYKYIANVGYVGIGKYTKVTRYKIYIIWRSMLLRCYDNSVKQKQPTYKDVTVCEEWHNFQNFAQWYEDNYKDNFHLDKDILIKGNKHYSPETCCFVPQEINTLFTKTNSKRGDYPIGVTKAKNKFRAEISIRGRGKYLDSFNTPEEAFECYKIAKEKYIKEMANEWKKLISNKVYQAMYNYQVEITD